jgi:hypothetical protein
MSRKPRPKVNFWPDDDKEWGGYKDAVQCIYCRRWMVVDFDKVYNYNGRRQHIQIFKELNWDGWSWYIDRRTHSPNICQSSRDRLAHARAEGFRSWKAYSRYIDRLTKEDG